MSTTLWKGGLSQSLTINGARLNFDNVRLILRKFAGKTVRISIEEVQSAWPGINFSSISHVPYREEDQGK